VNNEHKAVFLSYASEDGEAAKRICDALRNAGVEVWFDQNELVGGDAWDQKIRKHIKECALLVPIISAATQARTEGYFRLEWRLADQRTHLMAQGRPFLLPVVIDATSDAEAQVPDSFTEVQWTRLPGGAMSDAFCRRLVTLLRGGAGGTTPAVGNDTRVPVESAPVRTARLSETQQLVAKAWVLLNKPSLARVELEIADGLGQRATALDPSDADAWSLWSQVDSWYIYHALDDSPARREGSRTKAMRALQLAPDSFEARLAQACYLIRGAGTWDVSMYAEEAEDILRGLFAENPVEPRALLVHGILCRGQGDMTGARTSWNELSRNPDFVSLAWNEIAWAELLVGHDYRAAEVAADRSIALGPCWPNLAVKQLLALSWRGDLDAAKAAYERVPAAVRQEDHGVASGCLIFHCRREPAQIQRLLAGVARDWLRSNAFHGPKAWWAALAHEMAGRKESAQLMWQGALAQVERRLAEEPDSVFLLKWKVRLLIRLERLPEAEKIQRLAIELGGQEPNQGTRIFDALAQYWFGYTDAALEAIEREAGQQGNMLMLAASCRLNPHFDPLREHPRFQALQARLDADPRKSPTAPLKP
jgi:tetratricopeptide (TPR) repeat protein